MEVTLQQILSAREERVRRQQQLLGQYKTSLLCFTMNIAGPVKTSPLIARGFREGLSLLDSRLPGEAVLYRQTALEATGCVAFYAVAMPAPELKALCTAIEESHPLGRLFDMDVLDADGTKLEREGTRGCIVCGAPGRGCAARRLHSVAQLQETTNRILNTYFAEADRQRIAAAATRSLLDEVDTTPKPGLVDRRNSGSHTDMTLTHFYASAKALQPYFAECVTLGQETAACLPEETFQLLRRAGLQAEATMYKATGGVNTHKGAIYTLGILCGSMGRLWTGETPIAKIDAVLEECAKLVGTSAQADLAAAEGKTAGEQLFLQYGMQGIRGEVAQGLPSVRDIGLPRLEAALAQGYSHNDAGVYALLHLITSVEDTNLYHRGGPEGAAWAKEAVQTLLTAEPYPGMAQVEVLDDAFIARKLSPGGCADLLAVAYFLHSLRS